MYHQLDSPEDVRDLIARKEFYQLSSTGGDIPTSPIAAEASAALAKQLSTRFEPRTHQVLVGNMISPDTPYQRLHCNMQTGVGKTQAAIQAALKFIPVYKKIYAIQATKTPHTRIGLMELDRITPSIFILGFAGTKTAFIRDLIFTPGYGFTTTEELAELSRRRAAISHGEEYLKSYKDYYAWIRKRITNKSKGGFFKFYGYDEFALALFKSKQPLTVYEEETARRMRAGDQTTLEAVFDEHIAAGDIQINDILLRMFDGSLMICDEVHNTYNMNMRNNRGVAIQYVLDSVPTLRLITLSATAINNSPTEIVEVVNYHVPASERLAKRDLFTTNRALQPGALERLAAATRGRVTFIQDTNIKHYPTREFVGDTIQLPHQVDILGAGEVIPYLKFIPCEMSEYHQAAYMIMDRAYHSAKSEVDTQDADPESDQRADLTQGDVDIIDDADNIDDVDDNIDDNSEVDGGQTPASDSLPESTPITGSGDAPEMEDLRLAETVDFAATSEEQQILTKVPADGYTIYDMVFPNPTGDVGLYTSSGVRNTITAATQAQRDQVGIIVKRAYGVNVFTGPWLSEHLAKYSSKFATCIQTLKSILSNSDPPRKIMIYHERVQSSGVILIGQILLAAGWLDEYSEPSDNTICSICGRPQREHKEGENGVTTPTHEFNPSRFLSAHSLQDRGQIEQSMIKFNAVDNRHGKYFQIFLGSRIIKESYDFKDVRDLIILSLPTNIPTMLQVIGRVVRRGSHAGLDPEHRNVSIRILVSTVNRAYPHSDTISLELYRYIYKLLDYKTIQIIEREINRTCFDADIHRGINMSPDIRALYFGNESNSTSPKAVLGNLYFDPVYTLPPKDEITTATWHAYRYFEEEIHLCMVIIKRLFILEPAYTWDGIVSRVRKPPFHIESDTGLISEGSIMIALTQLVTAGDEIVSDAPWYDRLYDHTSKYVYVGRQRYKIEHVGEFYVRFPVEVVDPNPMSAKYVEKEYVRDRERAIIRQHVSEVTKINHDIESYSRGGVFVPPRVVSLGKYISTQHEISVHRTKRKTLFKELENGTRELASIIYDFNTVFQISLVAETVVKCLEKHNSTKHGVTWQKILDYYKMFDMLITVGEVRKYKDMMKHFKSGLPDDDTLIIGFTAPRSCRLYDPIGGTWADVSKLSLNRHITLKENDLLIGQFETLDNVMKFKIRRPVQAIAAGIKLGPSVAGRSGFVDTRLIERGTVCETKSKTELIAAANMLGIKIPDDSRIKTLCTLIRDSLIASEIAARKSRSRYAYVYSWWSEIPRVQV